MLIFADTDRVEFRLLGPVEVWVGDRLVDIGTPKRRAVFATLLVDAGSSLTLDTLIDRVWDQAPPPQVRSVLYVHLSRIRRVLADLAAMTGQPMALQRRSGGYAILVDPGLIDLHRSRQLVEQVRRPDRTDTQRALSLREALCLWRGDPLAGLPGEWAARVRERLRRVRLDIVLAWARTELRLGRPDLVVDTLYPLLAEHPTAEPLAALLMTALYDAGRGAEALDTYGTMHRKLVADLGADPGPELRALHRAILRGELDHPVRTPAAPSVEVPAQLPPDLREFAGREEQLRTLDHLLNSTLDGTGTAISAIAGMPGVGKTALAVHWAHRAADQFPDGQLYVNLRGFDSSGSPVTTGEAVRGFLQALHIPAKDIPARLDARVAMYRGLLAGRQVLIVLDNARDAEQVRPLLPGSAHCAVLVTSRDRLSGLVAAEGVAPMTLAPMSGEEARELLTRRIGKDRIVAEPGAADEIVTGCGHLPLALSVVAARAVAHPAFPLAALARELRAARDGLDVFDDGDAGTDVRSVFSWSYRALSARAAGLFRLLGAHAGPTITAVEAAGLAGIALRQARGALAELARAHLLAEPTPGQYVCHELLQVYAAELRDAALQQEPAQAEAGVPVGGARRDGVDPGLALAS